MSYMNASFHSDYNIMRQEPLSPSNFIQINRDNNLRKAGSGPRSLTTQRTSLQSPRPNHQAPLHTAGGAWEGLFLRSVMCFPNTQKMQTVLSRVIGFYVTFSLLWFPNIPLYCLNLIDFIVMAWGLQWWLIDGESACQCRVQSLVQ